MYCISIKFENEPSTWTLLYQNEDSAKIAWRSYLSAIVNDVITLDDDFGQTANFSRSSVAGAMFEDMDKSMLAHVERGLHNARTQAKAETIALNDQGLKSAALAKQRGPAIFSPQGNGGFHP